jgi:hypothetical protein
LLTTPTQDEYRALTRLGADEDFQVLIKYLDKCQTSLRSSLELTEEDRILRQQQGASQAVSDLIGDLKNASDRVVRR